jgi:helicase
VIVSTITLAAGVNLPADKVVVADVRRWDPMLRTLVPIDISEYKSCAGRAGRLGKRTIGESFLLAKEAGEAGLLANKYILGRPEILESAVPREGGFC